MALVLSTALGLRPWAILKTSGTVFFPIWILRLVNNLFNFFGRLLFKVGKEIGTKDMAYVTALVLNLKH